jgi:hypothetical protein
MLRRNYELAAVHKSIVKRHVTVVGVSRLLMQKKNSSRNTTAVGWDARVQGNVGSFH